MKKYKILSRIRYEYVFLTINPYKNVAFTINSRDNPIKK